MTSTNGTLYNKYCLPKEIINIISEERKAQNLTWKEINKLCGVKMELCHLLLIFKSSAKIKQK